MGTQDCSTRPDSQLPSSRRGSPGPNRACEVFAVLDSWVQSNVMRSIPTESLNPPLKGLVPSRGAYNLQRQRVESPNRPTKGNFYLVTSSETLRFHLGSVRPKHPLSLATPGFSSTTPTLTGHPAPYPAGAPPATPSACDPCCTCHSRYHVRGQGSARHIPGSLGISRPARSFR